MLTRKTVILLELESTYGTDPVPVAADDGIYAADVEIEPTGEVLERDYYRDTLSKAAPVIGMKEAQLTFKTEIKGSGAAGTAPKIGKLLQGCGMSETISVFNPYASQNISFFYQFIFHFSDNTRIFAPDPQVLSLAPLQRRDHKATDFSTVLAKINSNAAFRNYSIELIAVPFGIPVPVGGVVAQLTRIQSTLGESFTSIPSFDPSKTVMYLDNPEFNP